MSNIEKTLLASTSRVEAPFVYVDIGGYTFGVYEKPTGGAGNSKFYKNVSGKYPNYIQSLEIKKINGTINQYTLVINYPVTADVDPNFFEKIFSSVQTTRTIKFSYGDFSLPNYIYKDEEAIITGITQDFNMRSSVIGYTISAVSSAKLTLSGCYTFPYQGKRKPSDVIVEVLNNDSYHLLEVFTGMKDSAWVDSAKLIAHDDKAVEIYTQTNISALEYISKLASMMIPEGTPANQVKANSIYTVTTYEDTKGAYFKVQQIENSTITLNSICTYSIDVGYPTANIITEFNIKKNDNWSILYDYNIKNSNTDTVQVINSKGELETKFSPLLSGTNHILTDMDKTWWTKVTEYPIQAELKLKGLLKPAILMTYVKVNVWFYGNKHIASGYYIITSQVDKIDSNGYFTTLSLTRIAGDEGFISTTVG